MSGEELTMEEQYDYSNCQSLFGYAQEVHQRSGGVCQLCNAGAGDDIRCDLWRQFTVEHLIGESQGGGYREIKNAVAAKFPAFTKEQVAEFAEKIEIENMVTACSFCNSMTSRDRHDVSMREIIDSAPRSPQGVLRAVQQQRDRALSRKRSDVQWKLTSVRDAFEAKVRPALLAARRDISRPTRP
jgi:hypothetical protein